MEDEWRKGGGQKAGVYLLHSPFLFAVDFVVVKRRSGEENFCTRPRIGQSPQGQLVYVSIDSTLCLMAFTSMF